MGHGAADPLVAAVLLDVSNPLLTLRHDLCSLQVEMFVDHLQTHDTAVVNHRAAQPRNHSAPSQSQPMLSWSTSLEPYTRMSFVALLITTHCILISWINIYQMAFLLSIFISISKLESMTSSERHCKRLLFIAWMHDIIPFYKLGSNLGELYFQISQQQKRLIWASAQSFTCLVHHDSVWLWGCPATINWV